MELKYGNPPPLGDCVDLGTVPLEVVPRRIQNEGLFAGDMNLIEMYEVEVPPHRRAWLTVAYYRDKDVPTPWRLQVPGLGTLVYTDRDAETGYEGDNWQVL